MLFGLDLYYVILVMPAFLFALYAQYKVMDAFRTYSRFGSFTGITGAEAARRILYSRGIYDVSVEPVYGNLTDHYDPRSRTLRLSENVFYSSSLAAIGVAAHEAGHAIQHQEGYAPLEIRNNLVPIAGIGSAAGPIMAIFGIMFRWPSLAQLGIILFTAAVAFYVITLPVEFNASKRAVSMITSQGIVSYGEIEPVKKVLDAAAMTYVASTLVAVANLLRLVLLFGGISREE